jgi:TATA-binding protein-associated factor Taf7
MSKAKKHLRPVVSSINDTPESKEMLKLLRAYMKLVRNGEVLEIAVAALMKGGVSSGDFVSPGGVSLLGAIEYTKAELIREMQEEDDEDEDFDGDEDEDDEDEDEEDDEEDEEEPEEASAD